MKRSLTLVCVLASGLGVSTLAQSSTAAPTAAAPTDPTPNAPGAAAAPAGATKVAIILFQPAVAQTNEGQRDFAEVRKKYEPKQAQLKSQSDEVDTMKKSLQTQGSTLSDAERASRLKTIDEKEKSLQRSFEDAQNDFQSELNDTYQKLAEKVYGVMQSYAAQSGYSLVIDASPQQNQQPLVLWAAQSTNITEQVIAAYNQKSGVPAPPPSAPGAGTGTGTTVPSRPAGTGTRPSTTPK
jgi:outer membrane protein